VAIVVIVVKRLSEKKRTNFFFRLEKQEEVEKKSLSHSQIAFYLLTEKVVLLATSFRTREEPLFRHRLIKGKTWL
jgi:hypothetical protein